jgi:hypothetical protein
MSLFTRLHSIEKKYAFTFLGFVLAAIFGALSIYTTFFWSRNAQVRYTVSSIVGVYDIREEIGKLDIIYDGINIREKKQMLSLIALNVANIGNSHLTKALYDSNDPLGFKLNGGMLLKAEISQASNSYLFKTLNINLVSNTIVHFSPVIVDSGESFSVKILALHNENEFVEIIPLGKIAGVKEIELIPWTRGASKIPFWQKVKSGGIFIHLTRALSYFILLILFGLAIGIPAVILSGVTSKHKRKRHIRDFKSLSEISFKEEDDYIFESYLRHGEMYLMQIDHLFSSKKRLKNTLVTYKEQKKKGVFKEEVVYPEARPDFTIERYPTLIERYPTFLIIPKLLESTFLTMEDAEITINSHMQNTLNHFLRFLKGRGINLDGPLGYYHRRSSRIITVEEKID